MQDYVNHVVKACNIHIWGLCHISCDVANTMVSCIVGTCCDYCNALLHSATEKWLDKLQSPEQACSSRLQH